MKIDILKQIDEWWKAFGKSEKQISKQFNKTAEFDVAEFMHNHLECINNNIMWEFGPALNQEGHRLVITPENRKDLRPLVSAILEKAPQVPGWEFYPYRLPENFESAKATVQARTGKMLADLYFVGEVNKFNLIDLAFISLDAKDEEDIRLANNQAFVIVESLLGEEILDKWIGAIEIETKLPEDAKHYRISELNDWVNGQISKMKEALPDKPFYERANEEKWTLYKLKPEEKSEYLRQEDMFVGKTMCNPLWENTRSNYSFSSERFSKLGEIFCYVKIDGRDELEKEKFEDKAQIEDALDSALISSNLGCHIGGGTGFHYSYVDLALTDMKKGIKAVKDVLRQGNITKNAWVQFYDSELESEWEGIWDDSPPPPMPDFEEE